MGGLDFLVPPSFFEKIITQPKSEQIESFYSPQTNSEHPAQFGSKIFQENF